MPGVSATSVVAAAASFPTNVLVGEALAILPEPALARLDMSTSAAAGEMSTRFQSGLTVHADNYPVNPAVAAGVVVLDGRDNIFKGEIIQGQLDLRFASSAAGATNVTWRLEVAL